MLRPGSKFRTVFLSGISIIGFFTAGIIISIISDKPTPVVQMEQAPSDEATSDDSTVLMYCGLHSIAPSKLLPQALHFKSLMSTTAVNVTIEGRTLTFKRCNDNSGTTAVSYDERRGYITPSLEALNLLSNVTSADNQRLPRFDMNPETGQTQMTVTIDDLEIQLLTSKCDDEFTSFFTRQWKPPTSPVTAAESAA